MTVPGTLDYERKQPQDPQWWSWLTGYVIAVFASVWVYLLVRIGAVGSTGGVENHGLGYVGGAAGAIVLTVFRERLPKDRTARVWIIVAVAVLTSVPLVHLAAR